MSREPLVIHRIELDLPKGRQRLCSLYYVRQGDRSLCIRGRGWNRESEAYLPCAQCISAEEVDGTDDLSRQWYLRLLTYYKLLLDRKGLTVEEAAALSPAAGSPTAVDEANACLSYLAEEGYAHPPERDGQRYRPGLRRITDQ